MPQLELLALASKQITDQGLAHLRDLRRLRHLDLRGTSISNAGLVNLKELTGLQYFDFDSKHVTDAGLADLQVALPELDVSRQPPRDVIILGTP